MHTCSKINKKFTVYVISRSYTKIGLSLINKSIAGILMNPILIVMKNKAPTLNSINLNIKAAHNRQMYVHMYVCVYTYIGSKCMYVCALVSM